MDTSISIKRGLAKRIGYQAAMLLGFIYSNGGFIGTIHELSDYLGFTPYTLRRARKKLKDLGYIEEQRRGYPQKLHIRLTEKGERLFK